MHAAYLLHSARKRETAPELEYFTVIILLNALKSLHFFTVLLGYYRPCY